MENVLQRDLHSKFLALRSIKRLISSELFKEVYDSVSNDKKQEVQNYINNNDLYKIKSWIRVNRNIELGTMSIRQLRDKARELGVKNYSMLTTSMLLSAITKALEGD